MAWFWIVEAQLNPADPAAWVNVSEYVQTITRTYGRRSDLDQVEVTTLTVELENDDGRFTPENTLGAYYPRVAMHTRVRAKVDVNGTITTKFTGHAISWDARWGADTPGRVVLVANDALELFAGIEVEPYAAGPTLRAMRPDGYWPLSQEGELADLSGAGITAEVAGTVVQGADWIPYSKIADLGLPQYWGGSLGVGDQGETGTASGTITGAAYVPDSPRYGVANGSFSLHFRIWADMTVTDPTFGRAIIGVGSPLNPYTSSANRFRQARWFIWNGSDDLLRYSRANDDGTQNTWIIGGAAEAPRPDLGYSHVWVVTPTRSRVWVNGTLAVDTTTDITPRLSTRGHLWMGAFDPAYQFGYAGRISDVAIWGRDISGDTLFNDLLGTWRGWYSDRVGDRIGRLLNVAGWPAADRDLYPGLAVYGPILAPMNRGGNLADVIRQLGDTDHGITYVDGAGKVVFEGRHDRWLNRRTIVATFGDGANEIPYREAGLSYNKVRFQNAVTVEGPAVEGGEPFGRINQVVREDTASIDEFGRRDVSIEVDADKAYTLEGRASFELEARKDVHMEMPDLVMGEIDGDARAADMNSLELNALIRQYLRPAGSDVITRRRRIQQFRDTVTRGGYSWAVTLALSDAEVDADVAPYGTAVVGQDRWAY